MIDRLRRYLPEDWDILAVILFLTLALRIYFALAFNVRILAGYSDDFLSASSLSMPVGSGALGYPLFLKVIMTLSGGRLAAVFVLQAIIDSAAVMMLYFAVALVFSKRAALTAAVLAAVYPGYLLNTISVTPAGMIIFLATGLIAIGAAADHEKSRPVTGSVLTAVTVAAGILTEPSFVFLVPGLFIVSRRKIVFILVLAGFLLPWTVRNSIAERTLVPLYRTEVWRVNLDIYKSGQMAGYWRPVWKLYENARLLTSRGWAVGPDGAATAAERNSTYTAAYSYIVVMALGVVGLVKRYRSRHRSMSQPFIIYYLLLVLLTIFEARYRTALEPLLILYAGALVGESFRRRRGVRISPEVPDDPHQQEG